MTEITEQDVDEFFEQQISELAHVRLTIATEAMKIYLAEPSFIFRDMPKYQDMLNNNDVENLDPQEMIAAAAFALADKMANHHQEFHRFMYAKMLGIDEQK